MSTLSFALDYQAGPKALRSELDTSAMRVAIVGPSGIGKTTLLRAILGVRASRGPLTLRGARIDALPAERRALGWAPQDAALFPHLSVDGNLSFGSSEKPIDRIAALVGATDLLVRDVGGLSGGERQRVSLGRAIGRKPRMYVLDEPFSALDRGSRRTLAEAFEAERARQDAVVLLASHDESDVSALADEVYEMDASGTLTRRPWPG